MRAATRLQRGLGVALAFMALLVAGCASVPADSSTAPASTSPRAAGGMQPVVPSGPLSQIGTASTPGIGVANLAAPVDLWERIRRGLSMPDLDNDLVRDHERWYLSRPDYIQRMTERSSRYLFHIV